MEYMLVCVENIVLYLPTTTTTTTKGVVFRGKWPMRRKIMIITTFFVF